MRSSLEDDLLEIVRTYSPTGRETKAVEKFSGYLRNAGAQNIRGDAAGNSLGTFPGDGISIVLCGHIDTVPGKLPVRVSDGMLQGRGAVDAKSSLISLLYGARMAKDRGFRGTLHVIAATGEEGPGKGIVEVAASHEKTDYAIFGEPSGTTGITTGYRGRVLLDARFRSKSYHASASWMGKNAVDIAIDSWRDIRNSYGDGKDFSSVSVSLTSIHGGKADNVTPSDASLTLDVRYPPSKREEEVMADLKRFLIHGDNERGADLRIRSSVSPYVSNLKNPIVQAFKGSIEGRTSEKAKMIFKSGSGDMNILGASWKIPCVTYGPGNPQLSHTNDEIISIEEVYRSAEIVSDALMRLENMSA